MTRTLRHLLTFDLFLAVGVLLYSNTSDIPFYLDDSSVVGQGTFSHLTEILAGSWSFGRWLVGLTFAYGDYLKGVTPFFSIHRLTNILIHVFNAFGVYLIAHFVLELTGARSCRSEPMARPKSKAQAPSSAGEPPARPYTVPFLTGLLFLIHPLQTSTVNYLAQRYVLMATLFLIAAFLCYLSARMGKGSFLLYGASVVFFVFGLFCKQFVLVFPVLIFLAEWLLFRQDPQKLKKVILVVLLVVLASATYLQFIVGMNLQNLVIGGAPHPVTEYAMTQAWVVTRYLQMLVAPLTLALNHDLRAIESPFNLRFLVGLLVVAGLLSLALVTRQRHALVTFGILWYFVLLSESSSLVPRIDYIYDYRTYPANVGLFILLGSILTFLYSTRKRLGGFAIAGLLICYGLLSYRQNELWRNPVAFFEKEVLIYPENAKSWNVLGRELFIQGKLEPAEKAFENSLRHMRYANVLFRPVLTSLNYFYLAMIAQKRGRDELALEHLKKAVLRANSPTISHLGIDPLDPRVFVELAKAYKKTSNLRMWELVVKQALVLFPSEPVAWKEFKEVVERTPQPTVSPEVIQNLIEQQLRWRPGVPDEVEAAVRNIVLVYFIGGFLIFLGMHYLAIRDEIVSRMHVKQPARKQAKLARKQAQRI